MGLMPSRRGRVEESRAQGKKSVAGRVRYEGRGQVQAFLFLIVTSWQIPKLDEPGSGDIQQGQVSPSPAVGAFSASWKDWAPCSAGSARWGRRFVPPALGSDCALGGRVDQQGRARAEVLWAKDQGPPLE